MHILQSVMAAVLKAVKPHCPYCHCIQPKVKKVGKSKFMIQPIPPKMVAKNVSRNIVLRCVPLYSIRLQYVPLCIPLQ